MSERVFVIYHGTPGSDDGCCDGFCSAWAAWRSLGDEACYVPAEYGAPIPDIPSGAEVFMLDISYPRAVLDELASRTSLFVIDHHPTAEKELEGAPYAWFCMERSGAALSWMHFHSNQSIPNIVLYVEDRDLWKWKLDSSRSINAAIANTPKDFRQWDRLEEALRFPDDHGSVPYRMLLMRGDALLREQERLIEHFARNAYIASVGGIPVPVCNATAYVSELGHYLLQQYPEYPFVGIWERRADGTINWGLRARSLPDGGTSFHVGNFAREQFGGGGHPCAAGFREHPLDPSLVIADLKEFLQEAIGLLPTYATPQRRLTSRYEAWRRGESVWLGERKALVNAPGDIVRNADE